MLRVPQHERKKIDAINSFPFVLSAVEGLLGVFQQPARCPSDLGQYATKCFFAKQAAEICCQAVVVQRKCHPFLMGIGNSDLRTVWFGPIEMERYTSWLIDTFVGVGAEIVPLGL
jgi:hypothetical protein